MSSTNELCQCGHERDAHPAGFCAQIITDENVCPCDRFTPLVDEREKAWLEHKKHQFRGRKHGFDAGWDARDEEIERLKAALEAQRSRVLPQP